VESNCRLARVTLADISAANGISRANFSRWKSRIPSTIRVMKSLQIESRKRLAEYQALQDKKRASLQQADKDVIARARARAAEIIKARKKPI
jgi:hypothetical protein